MTDDERIELNRLWAEMRAAQMVIARLAAREFSREEIALWHEKAIEVLDEDTDISSTSRTSMTAAVDQMARLMRNARDAIVPPPPQ